MSCRRCRRDHTPVSLAEWTWRVREIGAKPPAGQLAVLWMLAARVDARTGCGWATRNQLAKDAGVKRDTVTRALQWAEENGLLYRAVRGHHIDGDRKTESLWWLTQQSPAASFAPGPDGANDPLLRSEGRSRGSLKRDQKERPGFTGASLRSAPAQREGEKSMPKTAKHQPGPDQSPLWPAPVAEPAIEGEIVKAEPAALNAGTLVAAWIEHCQMRPPSRVVGQVSKELRTLLEEGIPYEVVGRGLVAWHNKGQHPSTLASFVNAAGNAPNGSNGRVPSVLVTGITLARKLASGEVQL